MTIIAVNIFFKTLHINSRDKYTKNSPWIRKITIKLLDSIYLTQDSQFDLDASPSFGATHHTACLVPCKAYLGNTNGTFEKKTLGFFRPDTLRIPGGKLKGFFRDFLCKNPGRGGGHTQHTYRFRCVERNAGRFFLSKHCDSKELQELATYGNQRLEHVWLVRSLCLR